MSDGLVPGPSPSYEVAYQTQDEPHTPSRGGGAGRLTFVSFDDVGDQPVTLLAYELVLDDDVDTGIKVTALMEGTRRLTVRRA